MSCSKFTAGSYREVKGEKQHALCNTKFMGNSITSLNQFNLQRPRFLADTLVNKQSGSVVIPRTNRAGNGNFEMKRNNFIAPSIRGREMIDFEKLQAQSISEGGIKVQFGDKTIEKLFKIQVEDPTDLEWIAEYKIRKASGESDERIKQMPPFGRPQRQVTRMRNIGMIGKNINNDIETLSAVVLQSATETKAEIGSIIATLAKILGSEENIKQLTQENLEAIARVTVRVNMPADYRNAGFKQRINSLRQYRDERGLINLYLLSNLPPGRTLNTPLIKINNQEVITGTPSIENINSNFRDGSFLDLETRTLIPREIAIQLIETGIDGGLLDGEEEPPGGFPVREVVQEEGEREGDRDRKRMRMEEEE